MKYKDRIMTFRVTDQEYKQIKAMAGLYAGGIVSAWVLHCLENYVPKIIKKARRPAKKTRRRAGVHTN